MTIFDASETPPVMKRSRAKLWVRTGILAVFGVLFGLALYRDLTAGVFRWEWALLVFVPCLVIGLWMSKLVPMQVHLASRHITLSFDRVYFILILLLVAAKVVAGRLPGLAVGVDIIMCAILGLMLGRVSGICLRVRDLKVQHFGSLDEEATDRGRFGR